MSSNLGNHQIQDYNDALEDVPSQEFHGATLQIRPDNFQASRSPSSQGDEFEGVAKLNLTGDAIRVQPFIMPENVTRSESDLLRPAVSGGADAVSPITPSSIPIREGGTVTQRSVRTSTQMSLMTQYQHPMPPSTEEEAREFFTFRDTVVEDAIKDCAEKLIISNMDGELISAWLLTEINLWDHEKERLVLLTSRRLIMVKYDFIAMKSLESRKIPLHCLDCLVVGDLIYPPGSLVPRLNGLAGGLVTVVKDCLLRRLQDGIYRFPMKNANNGQRDAEGNFCPPSFGYISFEPRSRNVHGVRAMWNRGEPLTFKQRWNPFRSDIPWATYSSHPLLWHKGGENNVRFDVDDFASQLVVAVERAQERPDADGVVCRVERRPIILENYFNLPALIHNRNNLGFFKVRGKFSF